MDALRWMRGVSKREQNQASNHQAKQAKDQYTYSEYAQGCGTPNLERRKGYGCATRHLAAAARVCLVPIYLPCEKSMAIADPLAY